MQAVRGLRDLGDVSSGGGVSLLERESRVAGGEALGFGWREVDLLAGRFAEVVAGERGRAQAPAEVACDGRGDVGRAARRRRASLPGSRRANRGTKTTGGTGADASSGPRPSVQGSAASDRTTSDIRSCPSDSGGAVDRRGRPSGGTLRTVALDTYGHVFDELHGAGRISTEHAIRTARAEARATLGVTCVIASPRKKEATHALRGVQGRGLFS